MKKMVNEDAGIKDKDSELVGTEPLEMASRDLLDSVAAHKSYINQYYDEMAGIEVNVEKGRNVNTDFPGENPNALEKDVEAQVKSLLRTSRNLGEANRSILAMADELNARLKDMRKSVRHKKFLIKTPVNAAIDFEEQAIGHFARGMNAYKVMLIFFFGSFVGVLVELLWCFVKHGYFESRSALLFGPFNPVYGIGAVALSLGLYNFRNRGSWLSYLGGFFVGSAVEYFCSWFQELVFHSTSWDYSEMSFNLNGRICLIYSLGWGLLGMIWIKSLYPRIASCILKIPNKIGKSLTIAIIIFLLFDSLISGAAVWRWEERLREVPATSSISMALDSFFPDERMEKVYANLEFQEVKK